MYIHVDIIRVYDDKQAITRWKRKCSSSNYPPWSTLNWLQKVYLNYANDCHFNQKALQASCSVIILWSFSYGIPKNSFNCVFAVQTDWFGKDVTCSTTPSNDSHHKYKIRITILVKMNADWKWLSRMFVVDFSTWINWISQLYSHLVKCVFYLTFSVKWISAKKVVLSANAMEWTVTKIDSFFFFCFFPHPKFQILISSKKWCCPSKCAARGKYGRWFTDILKFSQNIRLKIEDRCRICSENSDATHWFSLCRSLSTVRCCNDAMWCYAIQHKFNTFQISDTSILMCYATFLLRLKWWQSREKMRVW